MHKKEEIDLIKKALSKLKYLKSKRYGPDLIDSVSFVFYVFVKHLYSVNKEVTHDELVHIISEKHAHDARKETLLRINKELEHLKYGVKTPTSKRVKKLLSDLIGYLKSRMSDVSISDMIDYLKLKISEVKHNEKEKKF